MSNIKFLNDQTEKIYNAELVLYPNNRLIITFEELFDSTLFSDGFVILNEHNGYVQADYKNMKYIYKDCDDGLNYILTSDKNDKYEEPITIEPTPIEPYIPNLDETKETKIRELSSICNKSITEGVDIEIDGNIEHFSYKDEDQVNIKELFDLAAQTNVSLYYHADNSSCKLYTVEQIVSIYSSNAINKMHHITYFNQLKLYVESLEDKDEVSAINYGDELTGIYLEIYNDAMSQANIGLTTLLGGK